MNPRVLLVCPEFPETFWSFHNALKFVGKRAAFPPLGLLTVAALLPEGWERRMVDMNVARLRDADLAWADLVLLTGMTVQRDSARRVIARCKALGVRVVAGGPLFTTEREAFPEVDHLVLNEAEITLPRFLADYRLGIAERVYDCRDDEFCDVTQTPLPAWELADLRAYASVSVQYSRGCPFKCEFCNVTALFGHRPRTKTVEQVLAELDLLHGLGWRGKVFFVDDNLIGNKARVMKELLPALRDWQARSGGVPFYTQVSINLADDGKLLEMMRLAGFESVFIGIETPSEESLSECSKKQNTSRDLIADVKRIQRAGIEVQAGFIVGFDNDTTSIFRRQIEFIQKSGIAVAMVGLLQAIKGTKLYERLESEGRLRGATSGDNVDGSTNIVPRMDLDTLVEGHGSILDTIYSPRNYYRRVRTFLRETQRPHVRERLRWRHLRAVVRSTFTLGVVSRERLAYWKLMLWTLFVRPELLPQAIALAIYGHHLSLVCVETRNR